MSNVANLILAGKAVAELGTIVSTVVTNGTNYLADLVVLPQLLQTGQDIMTTVAGFKEDLAEVTTLDDAGRTQLAAAWTADIPTLVNTSTDAVLAEGVVVLTYGLEAIGYFLRTYAPVPAPAPAPAPAA